MTDNLTDISVIRYLQKKYNIVMKKGLGQNFLTNPSVCPEMASQCIVDGDCGVLEIGPGFGVLTRELCDVAKKVVSVELDKRLIPVLSETLAEYSNVKIINDDILKTNISDIITREFQGMEVVVCANLPYYITSPVIMMLLESGVNVRAITVMVQKEAAIRLCATPGERECGAVSAAVNYYCKPSILFDVDRDSFTPVPNVDSSVIRLDMRDIPAVSADNKTLLFKIVRAAFSQRRKTAINSINSVTGIAKPILQDVFVHCDIDATIRAERITLEQFAKISNEINSTTD